MTKDEFCALPLCIALEALYDAVPELEHAPVPDVPQKPRYDGKLGKGNQGFVWMSEMVTDDLIYWHTKKSESASAGTKYSERDEKIANNLRQWIEWRRIAPYDQWWGTRGEDKVTAPPPRRNPKLQPWPANGPAQKRTGSGRQETQPADEADSNLDDVQI